MSKAACFLTIEAVFGYYEALMSDIWIGKASDVFVVAATLIHARTHLVMGRASCGITGVIVTKAALLIFLKLHGSTLA